MTTTTRQSAFQPQLSAIARFGTAVAVATVLALVWVGAEHESHQAVQTATAAFSGETGAAPVLRAAAAQAHIQRNRTGA